MKKIIEYLKTLGKPFVVKSGDGVMLINPTPPDEPKLESLCSSAGVSFIYNDGDRHNKPSLYVGSITPTTDEDLLAALDKATSK